MSNSNLEVNEVSKTQWQTKEINLIPSLEALASIPTSFGVRVWQWSQKADTIVISSGWHAVKLHPSQGDVAVCGPASILLRTEDCCCSVSQSCPTKSL